MKIRWLDRRIACPGPFLALCLSDKEYRAACAHLKTAGADLWINDGADATTHILTNPKGQTVCIVTLGNTEGRTPIEIAGLLVHEAVHVWQEYADTIGERHHGREQEAYAVQSIAQELMAEFARRM